MTSDTWNAATLEGSRPETGAARRAVILAVVFVVACLPVVISPVLPTIDFYDHLNRYFVLAKLSGHPFLGANYQSNWSLLPNIGLDVLGTGLMRWGDPSLVPKIITLFVFLVQYSGVLVFNRVLTGRLSIVTAVLCVPLLYSFIFVWGFANFLLGLGLVFWGAAAWLTLRRRLSVAVPVGVVFGLVIFLTHGVAFALYGILLGGLELGSLLLEGEGPKAFLQRMAALAVQAVAPAALFFASATARASGGVTTAGESLHQLAHRGSLAQRLTDLALYRLQTIVRVAEGPTLWFDVITLASTAALVLWLAARGRVSLPKTIWPSLLIGAILIVIVPPAMFGVGYISDRMPLFFAFVLVGGLAFRVRFDRLDAVPVGLLVVLAAARLAYIGDDWRRYEPDFDAYRAVASQIPPHKVVSFINGSLQPRLGPQRRCEMYGPLLISMFDQAAPLFAIPSAQPLRLKGQLAYALADLPEHRPFKGAEAADYYRRTLDAVMSQKRFDYALICDADLIGRPISPAAVVAKEGRFTVVRIR